MWCLSIVIFRFRQIFHHIDNVHEDVLHWLWNTAKEVSVWRKLRMVFPSFCIPSATPPCFPSARSAFSTWRPSPCPPSAVQDPIPDFYPFAWSWDWRHFWYGCTWYFATPAIFWITIPTSGGRLHWRLPWHSSLLFRVCGCGISFSLGCKEWCKYRRKPIWTKICRREKQRDWRILTTVLLEHIS